MLGEFLGSGASITKLLLHLNGSSADSSGNGNNGTDSNITYSLANGKFGQGAGFTSSSSSQIALPTSLADLNSDTAFSFSYWLKRTNTSSQFIGTRCNTSAHAQWNLYLNDGGTTTPNVAFEISPQNSAANKLTAVAVFSDLQDGNWHHIVITYSGNRNTSGVKIYIDGLSRTVTSITNTLSSNAPTGSAGAIGSRTSTFGSYLDGSIDEFIIETGVWSAEKVKKHYTMAKGRFGII